MFMNENYINYCINVDGKIITRSVTKKFFLVIFAAFKFICDRLFALIGLILFSPIMLVIAIIIKLDSKGPIIFKQIRTGKGGRNINIYKFRTMIVSNNVRDFTTKDKHTRVGAFLRKTSLDELPQLFSIFLGNMSFIGPRPWIPEYYENMNDIQRQRYCVRPGLTGLAQVSGRNKISIFDKINYDLEYIKNYSLHQDIKIVFLTIKAVIKGSGADAGKDTIKKELTKLKNQTDINEALTLKKEMDLVSIIVPVYNAEKYLDTTIETVLNQTYSHWELILVNDCSIDGSRKIYEKFKKDRRIKWINLKTNSGAAVARNKGIEFANGRYICFLDADDLWKKNKLEKQILFMKRLECAFSFTGYEFANEMGLPNGKKVYIPTKINYRQALKNTTIWTSTVMFDMNKLSKDDIYMPNVRRGQDTATWWKVLKITKYAYGLNNILSYYRRTNNSLSSNKIKALKRTWYLYRKVEHLGIIYSFYNFSFYCFNAVKRRV